MMGQSRFRHTRARCPLYRVKAVRSGRNPDVPGLGHNRQVEDRPERRLVAGLDCYPGAVCILLRSGCRLRERERVRSGLTSGGTGEQGCQTRHSTDNVGSPWADPIDSHCYPLHLARWVPCHHDNHLSVRNGLPVIGFSETGMASQSFGCDPSRVDRILRLYSPGFRGCRCA